jgi:hypothetical protein
MPSFPVRLGLAVAGAEDVGRTWSLFPPSGEFGCSLGFSGEWAGSGSLSFFFLPPITLLASSGLPGALVEMKLAQQAQTQAQARLDYLGYGFCVVLVLAQARGRCLML